MTEEPKRDDPTDFSQFRKPARKVDLAVVDSANEFARLLGAQA